ncbi:MAG: hypothetical protein J6S21_06960, partial [Victivallales bacterium]|nr:hypothetical protein [Victivallales bacterium]
MSILLITPPLLQLNTPYPATPVLLNLLRRHGFEAFQCDLAIETALAVFTPEILRAAADKAAGMKQRDDRLEFFLESVDDYCRTLPQVIEFLQGKRPELQWRIAARNFLPEGPYFQSLYNTGEEAEEFLGYAFGRLGTHDQAKYLASLYLDDLTFYISATLDSGFGFGKYEAHLGESLPAFEPLLKRLKSPATAVDAIIERLVREKLAKYNPDFVGITIPFPGTLYGAFRIAAAIREAAPQVKIIFGGGYVNSELRDLEDRRVFDFADYLAFDDGLPVLAEILNGNLPAAAPASEELPRCQRRLLCRDGFMPLELKPEYRTPPLLAPDYDGLDMNLYFDVVEMPNPLHRIWSDGRWLKMQLAQGCYWHKCAFCDLALDYIGRYEAADAVEIVNEMERLMQTTGHSGFHFVDEAIPPALAKGISKEIIRRKLN